MKMQLSIDRFEGVKKEIAVLMTEDGRSLTVPRDLLPKGAKAGEILAMTWERDPKATAELGKKARAVRDDLAQTDPGGDIKL